MVYGHQESAILSRALGGQAFVARADERIWKT